MNGFERRRQNKKSAIITAALDLFTKQGIRSTSITDIAKKAAVSRVSIYNYFTSKDGLVKQVLVDFMDSKFAEFKEFIDGGLSFKEKLEIACNMKTVLTAKMDEKFLIEFSRLLTNPEMQQFVSSYYETRTKPLIIQLIDQGKDEGEVDASISNQAVLLFLESFMDIATKPVAKRNLIDLQMLIFYGLRGKRKE
jgi:AcrR family transcriptional regulator